MPPEYEKRMNFKAQLLEKSLELTRSHAFASSQGNGRAKCVVGGDYNLLFLNVDLAFRNLLSATRHGPGWEVADDDPNGNGDFLFANSPNTVFSIWRRCRATTAAWPPWRNTLYLSTLIEQVGSA